MAKKKDNFLYIVFLLIGILSVFIYVNLNPATQIDQINESELFDYTEYNVYFCPEDDCVSKLEDLMKKSNSIRCSVYEVNLDSFYDIARTKIDEGLEFLLVSDDDQFEKSMAHLSKENSNFANELLSSKKIVLDNKSSYMHNKFCLFGKDTIWIGSMNFTYNDKYYNNNNVLVLKNEKIYNILEEEFLEQYFGVFSGGNKSHEQLDYPKIYFCPEDDCIGKYIETVNLSKNRLWCSFFSFTHNDLANSILNLDNSIDRKFIFESSQITEYSRYQLFLDNNISVVKDKNPKAHHNKFCIIDFDYIITGSQNPSNNSQNRNDESIIIIKDKKLNKSYADYFKKYWSYYS